jgi:hypothetical protein
MSYHLLLEMLNGRLDNLGIPVDEKRGIYQRIKANDLREMRDRLLEFDKGFDPNGGRSLKRASLPMKKSGGGLTTGGICMNHC